MKFMKAICGGATAGLTSALAATADNSGITTNEGLAIALAVVSTFAAVYFVSNGTPAE